jgi:hypothetical protein
VAMEDLRKNGMLAHVLDALDAGEDIGHDGKLVFAMVARHFMDEDELLAYLQKNPEFPEEEMPSVSSGAGARQQSAAARAHPGMAATAGVPHLSEPG